MISQLGAATVLGGWVPKVMMFCMVLLVWLWLVESLVLDLENKSVVKNKLSLSSSTTTAHKPGLVSRVVLYTVRSTCPRELVQFLLFSPPLTTKSPHTPRGIFVTAPRYYTENRFGLKYAC